MVVATAENLPPESQRGAAKGTGAGPVWGGGGGGGGSGGSGGDVGAQRPALGTGGSGVSMLAVLAALQHMLVTPMLLAMTKTVPPTAVRAHAHDPFPHTCDTMPPI